MQVKIVKVKPTPSTPNHYQLTLSCGHMKAVSRPRTPALRATMCGECQLEANRRAAEIDRTAAAIGRREDKPWFLCSQGEQEDLRRRARKQMGIGS